MAEPRDRVVLMDSCLWDNCRDCPEWIPDPWSDPEEPTEVICNCGCHDVAQVAPGLYLVDDSPPPF